MQLEKKRKVSFIVTAGFLMLVYLLFRNSLWQGSTDLHTIMEVVATILALMIGVTGLIRFHAKPNETIFLFVGAGFLGTGFLDGYHAVVTSHWFNNSFPSPPESLIPWSWIASRLYLSFFLFLAYMFLRRDRPFIVYPARVYGVTAITTLASFIFFAFVPLPQAYYPGLFFHRPEELIPAIFFAFALYGFYLLGEWKKSCFHFWLIHSIIINLISQAVFMSFSEHLFDYEFDMAHILKKASYIAVLIGVYVSMLRSFQQEVTLSTQFENEKSRLKTLMDNSSDGIHIIDEDGNIIEFSKSFASMLGYTREELQKLNVYDWDAGLPKEKLREIIQELIHTPRTFETKHKQKNGKLIDVQINAKGVTLDGKTHLFASARDITFQKMKEKEDLLMQEERFRQMREMIINITHHWRQPLNVISLTIQGLEDSFEYNELDAKTLRSGVQKVVDTTEKMSDTLNQFRKLVSSQETEEIFSLNQTILEVLELVHANFKPHYINIENVLGEDVEILGRSSMLMNVMYNILNNAKDQLMTIPPTANRTIKVTSKKEDETVVITIVDNGGGIKEENIDRIFDPFFTTKELAYTTGNGLYFTKITLEEEFRGTISVHNEKKGACFTIKIPLMINKRE